MADEHGASPTPESGKTAGAMQSNGPSVSQRVFNFWDLPFTVMAGLSSGSLGLIVVLAVAACHDYQAWLSGMLGAGVGWVIGVLVSPYQEEERQFGAYAKVGSGFLTGFAVSKVDRIFDLMVGDPGKPGSLLDPIVQARLLIAFTCFFLSMMITLMGRRYAIERKAA
jgi:hypothetical protein